MWQMYGGFYFSLDFILKSGILTMHFEHFLPKLKSYISL